jgi:exodeoxyribonuclease V gamma subunit
MILHRSNRMERLVDGLADLLARPRRDIMAADLLVVPSDGMGQWVSVAVAERLGVAAHIDVRRPRAFVESVFRVVLGDRSLRLDLWSRDALVWELMVLLPAVIDEPVFGPLRRSVVGVDAEQRYLLCRRLADAFDQYAVYRPQLVLGWEAGEEPEDWQAELWRRLVDRVGGAHTARMFARTMEALSRGDVAGTLPERALVFGLAALPPLYLDVLCALAEHTEVHLFQLAPSTEYWALIRSRREQARRGPAAASEAEARQIEGHPLLAGFGRVGRDFQELLADRSEVLEGEEDDFEEAPRDTLLHRLQDDLLHLRAREPDAPKETVAADDRSVLVLGAHAPVREVEVLRDALWDLLHRMPDLQPRDIVVMTPDLSTHGPLVEAVFGVEQDDALYLPMNVADRTLLDGHGCAAALLALIALASSRCTATELLDLLDHAPLREHTQISSVELPMVARLVDSAGVRWGRDAAHRATFGQPPDAVGTWRAGLDRLVMGTLADGLLPCAGVVPVEHVVGEVADLTGRLVAFAEEVLGHCEALSRLDTIAGHAGRLRAVAEAWFGGRPEQAEELRQLRERLTLLEAVSVDERVSPGIVRRAIEGGLQEERRSGGFLRGGITVCEMMPMRAVPFRVVCMLGMSDGLFPRSDAHSAFDRIAQKPQRGDRSRRDDDRYMFLEALLSARDAVVLTAVTRSVRDDRPLPPSVVLTELLDALSDGYAAHDGGELRGQIVVQHPLQPFSWRYVDPTPPAPPASPLATWDATAAKAASVRGPQHGRPIAWRPIPMAMPAEISLPELERFLRDPVTAFLRWRLAARDPDDHQGLDERAPVQLDDLERWEVAERWIALARRGLEEAEIVTVLRAEGWLATGAIGEVAVAELRTGVQELLTRARPRWSGARRPVVVDEEVRGVRVVGRLVDVFDGGQVGVTWRKLVNGKARSMWWLRHLALQAVGGAARTSLIGRGADGRVQVLVFRALEQGEARERLEGLVALVEEGRTRPLRAEIDLAAAWWEARQRGDDDKADEAAEGKLGSEYGGDARRRERWLEMFGDLNLGARREAGEIPDLERVARAVFEGMEVEEE